MAFRYIHTQTTGFDGKIAVTLIRYDTLEELLSEHYQMPYEEMLGSIVTGQDGHGKEYNLEWDEMIDNVRLMGCYGFACKKQGESQIHFWVDVDSVDPVDFIGLIAHEKGHLLKPWKRDQGEEEAKAERYADTATFAFQIAKDLLKKEVLTNEIPDRT